MLAVDARVEDELNAIGVRAREAAQTLRSAPAELRTEAIEAMARRVARDGEEILSANASDLEAARARGLAAPQLDRLRLDAQRLDAIAASLRAVAAQPDPVNAEIARWGRPNGLDIARVRTPIGVIAVIYEARPNVTADAAALCLRSGNAAILRGGSESFRSNRALHRSIQQALVEAGLPAEAVQMPATADRSAVAALLGGLGGTIDLLIPRGGKSLVARVREEARVPVLGHLEGICHTYVHAAADPARAASIVANAKMRRVSVCGATETLLIDAAVSERLLPAIAAELQAKGCELRGDPRARAAVPDIRPATEADWGREFLAPILAIRVVEGLDEAVAHIRRYGSGHTDAIVTEDPAAAERFLNEVDSAIVMLNASTQFADGGEFGFGAEIGIATDKLHARGPVGAEQLTTFKYQVRGTGQVRG